MHFLIKLHAESFIFQATCGIISIGIGNQNHISNLKKSKLMLQKMKVKHLFCKDYNTNVLNMTTRDPHKKQIAIVITNITII